METSSRYQAPISLLPRLIVAAAILPAVTRADQEFCAAPAARDASSVAAEPDSVVVIGEVEPNNSLPQAQGLPLASVPGTLDTIDVASTFGFNGDVDFVRFTAQRGDVLGVSAVSDVPGMPVDTVLMLLDASGVIQQSADAHAQALTLYPPETRVRQVITADDAILLWVVPNAGDYVIRVQEGANRIGPYTLRLFLGRPGLESGPVGRKQILFLDFDGATINAPQIFGFGNPNATLSPLAAFLANWGLGPASEDAAIDEILAQISADLNSVAALNPRFGFELRNSRDHVDTFGADPFVSRVIVGGTATQLGITTNGIAQWFDLGNYSTDDTAVVLLDRLSAPAGGPDSINSVPRAPGVTILDAIGAFVGRVISHEIGHYVGHLHTDPTNGTPAIMDRANIPANLVGVGPDGIFGSADDFSVGFGGDVFDPFPGFLSGLQPVNFQTSFGLSTATRTRFLGRVTTPPKPGGDRLAR